MTGLKGRLHAASEPSVESERRKNEHGGIEDNLALNLKRGRRDAAAAADADATTTAVVGPE